MGQQQLNSPCNYTKFDLKVISIKWREYRHFHVPFTFLFSLVSCLHLALSGSVFNCAPQLTFPTVFLSNCVLSFHKHGMEGKSLVTQQVRQTSNLQTSRVHKYSEDLYFSQAYLLCFYGDNLTRGQIL